MSYQALYRTWRPQNFKDVVGQTHITRTLQNAIEQQKFSHAYLFSGPRGTGKTSAAKIFAKTINCEHAPTREACNECDACKGIQNGSISDVIEIDAASHTSVDDIREIREKVKYAPSTVPYKVYIIDEVHMISTNAFNALLKTLEEPPQHVVFILATTEPHKIPLTIISRCQRFDFKPISNRTIVQRMEEIVEAENVPVTQEALETVSLASEGGMRDALSILDQAISYSNESVELSDVLAVTGGVSQSILTDMVKNMYAKKIKETLHSLDDLIQNGKDSGRLVYDLIYFLRDVLLYKSDQSLENMLERAVVDESFQGLTEEVTEAWVQQAIMQLNQCQREMKWTNHPKVFIEMALIMITNRLEQTTEANGDRTSDESMSMLTTKLSRLEKELADLKQRPVQTEENPIPSKASRRSQQKSTKKSYQIPYERIRHVLKEAQKEALQAALANWATFLNKLKIMSAPAHATIQDSKPAAASNEVIVVAFKYEIHCSLFLDNREIIESVLAEVMNQQLSIIPIPVNDWQVLRREYVKGQESSSSPQKKENDPLIEKARELVGDDLIEVHD